MSPKTLKTLMTLFAVVAGSASQTPDLPVWAQCLCVGLSAGLASWAHLKRPGDAPSEPQS